MPNVQIPDHLTTDVTRVARYVALEQTAGGLTLPDAASTDHSYFFPLPGVIAAPAVMYYRTRHTGTPAFSVRINEVTLTRYTFVASDEAERTWHEIIPAAGPGGPTLHPESNELILFANEGSVVFGDIVIVYASNEVTIPVPVAAAQL
jgi:hypothetical protein